MRVDHRRFWIRVQIGSPDECWPWLGPRSEHGYGLFTDLDWKTRRAHRHVAGDPPGLVVRHTCDNPPCCNPLHLLVGTQADNVRDRDERGRTARGVRNWSTRFTADDVVAIREACASGVTQAALAEKYDVAPTTIAGIVTGYTWKHVGGPIRIARRGKLTPDEVLDIRTAFAAGADRFALADQYGVHVSNIAAIVKGISWKHVGGPIFDSASHNERGAA